MSLMNHHDLEYKAYKYGIWVLVVLTVLVFLVPIFARIANGSPITPGAVSYAQLSQSEQFLAGKGLPTPYGLLLAVMIIFGVPWLLPALLAGIFVVLLGILLAQHLKSRAVIIMTLGFLIISPAMSVLGTTHTPLLLAGILVILILLVYEKIPIIAGLLFTLLTITVPIYGIITLIILLVFDNSLTRKISYGIVVLASLVWCIFTKQVLLSELLFTNSHLNIIFELGIVGGISVFFLIIGAYGLMMGVYGDRSKMLLVVLTSIVFAILFPSSILLLTALLSLLVAYALMQLLMVDWQLDMLQESMLIIISCLTIFLVITTMRERITEVPDGELSHALIVLRESHREGSVFTSPEYAPLVVYFAGRDAALRADDSGGLLLLREANRVYPELERKHVAYVLITQHMKETIFTKSDAGILYLLQNDGRFVQVGESKKTATWYFISLIAKNNTNTNDNNNIVNTTINITTNNISAPIVN